QSTQQRFKMKAPRISGALPLHYQLDATDLFASGGLRLDLGVDQLAIADWNLPRLLGLGNLPDQVDVQQAVLQRGAFHLDKVGELEYALECARRDALVEDLTFGFGLRLLLAADGQRALLGLDGDIGLGEPSDRYRDAILIIAGAFD